MRRLFLVRFAILNMALLLACGQAGAQFGGSHRGGRGGSNDAGQKGDKGAAAEATRMNANDQVRMQLTHVRTALKLSPEQAPAWQAFEERVLSLLDDLGRGTSFPAGEGALKQIDQRVDLVRNRLAALEDIADAAKKLYAGLSAEQRETADRTLPGTVPALYSGSPAAGQFRGSTRGP